MNKEYTPLIDLDAIHYVDPASIEFCEEDVDIMHFRGAIVGGEWDLSTKRFDDLDIYIAFKDVFEGGKAWAETVFYQRIGLGLAEGRFHWGCLTLEDFDRRTDDLSQLYWEILRKGYKSQKELQALDPRNNSFATYGEVVVCVGRNGQLLLSDGAHRLCIAKMLALESIPVEVAARHPLWVKRVKDSGQPEKLGGSSQNTGIGRFPMLDNSQAASGQ
jgi:hypothetical protein